MRILFITHGFNGLTQRLHCELTVRGHEVSIEFDIKMLAHKDLNAKLLGFLLDFGEFKGLGQWRNGGFGRFTYSITEA